VERLGRKGRKGRAGRKGWEDRLGGILAGRQGKTRGLYLV